MTIFRHASYLAFNFACTVIIVFVNKAIFASFHFRFTTALTAMHYIVTLMGLEFLAAAGVFERRSSPMTPRLFLLSTVVGTAPALNNLSLSLNNLGFYQVVKLLVTPAIIGLEASLFGRSVSAARLAALCCVCVGVGVAVVNDLSIRPSGLLAALCWVPVAAIYKVFWSYVAKEEEWHTFALMRRVLPLSTVMLLALVPLLDPPGILNFPWTTQRAVLIALSGVAAFFVNWSGFLVMGACSALTHTLLGQLKACVIILGGYLFFAHSYPPKAIAGASIAVVALVLYTRVNLAEQAVGGGPRADLDARQARRGPHAIGRARERAVTPARRGVEESQSASEDEGERCLASTATAPLVH
jgi:drug/metabolite transporter (DMT)-like permease